MEELTPWLRRFALKTPTLPPATTTNTLVVGRQRLLVIEPATPDPNERDRLTAELDRLIAGGARVEAIAITHHHPDHIGYVTALKLRYPAPVYAHEETATRVDFAIDRPLEDGDEIELDDGIRVRAVFTPGHAPGHLVYHELRSGIAHAGDMVAGEGTILIDPEDAGDMRVYLESLRRLRSIGIGAVVPAHGPVIDEPDRLFDHYIEHRLERERKVVVGIGSGPTQFDEVLAAAYADTPRFLWPLAARSLEAHLRKLEDETRIARDGESIRLLPSSG